MTSIRLGVLGCADIARRRMLPAAVAAPDVELVAVASRDSAKADRTAAEFGCRPVVGYAELLKRDDVDAVYVPLPAALHAEWVEAGLRAGKHLLAEKPLTTDLARTAELVVLARALGLALWENVMFVHHSQHREVRRLLASGAIGEPRFFRSAFAVPRRPKDDIRHRADLDGGALWDTGVYPLRAAQYFLGGQLHTVGATRMVDPQTAVDICGAALLRSRDGVSAHLSFSLDNAYQSMYELWGSEGRIVVGQAFTPAADHRPELRLFLGTGMETIRLDADDQASRTLAGFATAVRETPEPDAHILPLARLLEDVRGAVDASPKEAEPGQTRVAPADARHCT
jgi:NDP-hexose-3-ketoreductase